MTAPMTPTRSGSPTGSTGAQAGVGARPRDALGVSPADLRAPAGAQRLDADPPATEGTPVPPAAQAPPPTSMPLPRPEERRAQRAARRHRRQLALWCAVLIAFCLGVTILIVIMAGNRTPGPQAVTTMASAAPAPAPTVPFEPSTGRGPAAPASGRA